jgi:hypothetical protein
MVIQLMEFLCHTYQTISLLYTVILTRKSHILSKEQTLLLGIYKAQSNGRHEIPSALQWQTA